MKYLMKYVAVQAVGFMLLAFIVRTFELFEVLP